MPAKQRLSRRSISVLREFRTLAYLALAPLDYVSRIINGKGDFPPLHLRRHVGPLRTFEASGAEFMGYLRLLTGLQPNESILDIGCGLELSEPIRYGAWFGRREGLSFQDLLQIQPRNRA